MKWIADSTGRFQWRPYYTREELDAECEQIVTKFLLDKYGALSFPISTDDLSVMIERDTSDLDLYADLSGEGEDVEGLTDFFSNKKPVVKISKELSLDNLKSHRLRTTLAHEYGHVKFHYFLWDMSLKAENKSNFLKVLSRQRRKFEGLRKKSVSGQEVIPQVTGPRCRSTSIIDAPVKDWMEWQAGYAAGALLMPVTAVKKYLGGVDRGGEIITGIAKVFDVSADAAKVRLSKLGILPEITGDSVPVKDSVSYK